MVFTLFSVSTFSQKITDMRKCKDKYGKSYVKVTVDNNDIYSGIVYLSFGLQYYNLEGRLQEYVIEYSNIYVGTFQQGIFNIRQVPRNVTYYKRLYVKCVVYENGEYRKFK